MALLSVEEAVVKARKYINNTTRLEIPTNLINNHIKQGSTSTTTQCHTLIDPISIVYGSWNENELMELGNYLYDRLSSVSDVRIYGPAPSRTVKRAALCSFNVKDVHPTDIATFLDQQHGVAIRSGHHCAQPLHRHLGISASARASLHFYNTKDDVDRFIDALKDTINFFTSFK
ncbi:hypothetical protein MTR67_024944 [Solanum verrucosum]|uniref:Aminotransferase class V domain-containing protein n=1 Tax=Solanum verrucosum TaxID=315347 RepID=A0AAF0QW90_SOLVR|nr:hypothetical protein MTR67_024944 [Solanum verrucosum]